MDEAVEIAARLARRFEGCRLKPYLCPAGVPTIGYGATYYEDGAHVTLQDAPITQERAEALLVWMIRTQYLQAAQRLCPGADTPARLAAVTDFAFNLGVGVLQRSTLRRRVNLKNWPAAIAELKKWTRGGGKVLAGLVARRNEEAILLT